MANKLKIYHFDLGNSSAGPIGYCASIKATTKKEALGILKRVIPEEVKILPCGSDKDNAAVVYIEAYLNDEWIKTKDIDFEDEEE